MTERISKPLSNDLRARIIRFDEHHGDYIQPEIAEEFGVSASAPTSCRALQKLKLNRKKSPNSPVNNRDPVSSNNGKTFR